MEGLGARERVLQAALELFVEQGYFNTNVPHISRRSKCSVGSIYHHFINKEEIARELHKAGINEFRSALLRALEGAEQRKTEDLIKSIVVAFLKFAEEHRLLAQYLWLSRHSEFLNNNVIQPTVVGFDKLGRELTTIIKGAIRRGEIPRLRAQIIWSIIFGIPIGYVRDWLDGYVSDGPSSVAPILSQACWAALTGTRSNR